MTGVLRVVFVGMAFISPFLFPYPFTLALSFIASVFAPWVAVSVGLLMDAIFMIPHQHTVPLATLVGAGISFGALIVRRFVKARIM